MPCEDDTLMELTSSLQRFRQSYNFGPMLSLVVDVDRKSCYFTTSYAPFLAFCNFFPGQVTKNKFVSFKKKGIFLKKKVYDNCQLINRQTKGLRINKNINILKKLK